MTTSDGIEVEVCQDFKKGNCSRGSKCKFSHPAELPESEVCREFLRRGCSREYCKFLHVSCKQDLLYDGGNLPTHIHAGNRVTAMNNSMAAGNLDSIYGKRLRADSSNLTTDLSPLAKKAFLLENKMKTTSLCRDFEKGNCQRGDRCKYFHPKLGICRDFQNKKCERETCRFLHITQEEEDLYNNSSEVPEHIGEEKARKSKIMETSFGDSSQLGGLGLSSGYTTQNEANQPCYDFDKGKCTRGSSCKYFHPKLNMCRDFQQDKCERETCQFLHMTPTEEATYMSSGHAPDHIDESKLKRCKLLNLPISQGVGNNDGFLRKGFDNGVIHGKGFGMSLSTVPARALQENKMLKLKLKKLQCYMTDLLQLNDTLYEQNMIYRKQAQVGN